MKTELIDAVEKKSLKPEVPHFEVGDTVDVHYKITEGDKTRVQIFTGTVIAKRGRGMTDAFTVRRIVDNEGVERTFPLHSPNVVNVKTVRSGKTRRAKLYYLRQRTGKAVKLTEKRAEQAEAAS
ncbi:MAG: 50S ribosomal protein L19 [Sedimentisphaerales bacterium]